MARFKKHEVLRTMRTTGFVPLFFNSDLDVCIEVVNACYKGGARLLEFTNRGDFAHEVFGELNKYCAKHLPEMVLGVGSVTDGGMAALYLNSGANFVVTPVFREDIARVCNRKKVPWSPGCGSLTEICTAEELGCDIVKLFPGGIYGPAFIKAIKGPQPWTEVMPTGGVDITEENLRSWFDAGATCVGIGSKLISKDLLNSKDYAKIEERVAGVCATLKKIR